MNWSNHLIVQRAEGASRIIERQPSVPVVARWAVFLWALLMDDLTRDRKIAEHRQPPTPELSRLAWTASSRIDTARNETRPIYRLPPEILAAIVHFHQSERSKAYHSKAYKWVRLMLVSRLWKATILAFPSLWSNLVMSASVSQSWISTVVGRSGSHPLHVVIPPLNVPEVYPKSVRHRHIDLAAELLPRISQLVIVAGGGDDTYRIYRAFGGRPADQLQWFHFVSLPSADELFVLHAPRLRSLHLSGAESWPDSLAENLTHIHLDFVLNPRALERDLKNSPRLEQIKINGVYQVPERFWNRFKISLIPGVRLIIMNSDSSVASLFALGSTNYLSITRNTAVANLSITSFLKLTLPQDISCFRNLDDLTKVHLKLIDSGERPQIRKPRTVTVILRCSTADRETLHINLEYILSNLRTLDVMGMEITPERPPAMRALNYLRPLDLRRVVELRMEGFVGEWGLQSFELYHFLQHLPVLRRIVTGDDNKEIFWFALSAMGGGTSVIVEGV